MQMGSHMKKAKSQQQIADAWKRWQQKAKKNQKIRRNSYSGFQRGSTTASHGSSALYVLQTDDNTEDIETPEISAGCYYSQYEASHVETDALDNLQSTNKSPISNPVAT